MTTNEVGHENQHSCGKEYHNNQLKFLKFSFLLFVNFKSIRKSLRPVLAQAWIRNITRLMKIEGSKTVCEARDGNDNSTGSHIRT